jgi:dTDP-4-dehydrorhamnose 3,5-epimerase
MQVSQAHLSGVMLVEPSRIEDERGFFSEIYKSSVLNVGVAWVQENQSRSTHAGTLRGLHLQFGDYAQAKLIRVTRGRIFDVVVDLRRGSSTFGQHETFTFTEDDLRHLFVPEGFAHGFCTLEPATDVVYKVSQPYSAAHEGGVIWNDATLGIAWPFPEASLVISARDRALPLLKDAHF